MSPEVPPTPREHAAAENDRSAQKIGSVPPSSHTIEVNASQWYDVTGGTITVLKGTKYTFRATPYPTDVGWPPSRPVWTLNGSAVGSPGDTSVQVTFDSAGTKTLVAKCGSTDPGKTVTINVVAPVPDEVSFVDNITGEEHDIYNVADPVWKRVNDPNNPACYTMNKKMKINAKFWASAGLTYPTQVKVKGSDFSEYSGMTFQTWPSSATTHIADSNLANTIGSDSFSITWTYKVIPEPNQSVTMSSTSGPHKIYRVFEAPKSPEAPPHKNILDYACTWASGATGKDGACSALLSNGFASHYTWDMDCHQLSSDFVRLVACIGVDGSLHRWSSKASGLGDMYYQRTKSIDPVGPTWGSGSIDWSWHQWAEAESQQRDPSAAASLSGNWGDYEDDLFTHYRVCTQVTPTVVYTWVSNQAGQSVGCEQYPTHCAYNNGSGLLQSWLGPDR